MQKFKRKIITSRHINYLFNFNLILRTCMLIFSDQLLQQLFSFKLPFAFDSGLLIDIFFSFFEYAFLLFQQ